MTVQLGIALALLCALTTNLGFFYKHRGACQAAEVDFRHPIASARSLFSSRWFVIGMLVAVGAWILHVAAMAIAPLSVVQVVLASGMVLIGVMADKVFGFEVGRRQWIGLALMGAGLAALAITAPGVHGAHSNYSVAGMISFETGFLCLGGLLIIGPRAGAPARHHGSMLGAAAGILFGVSDVAIKALTGTIAHSGPMGLISPWLAITVLASVLAFFASARGLQEGQPVAVVAITGAAANVSAIAGGILVFNDPLPNHVLGLVVQAVGFLLVLVAAAYTPAPAPARGASAPAAA